MIRANQGDLIVTLRDYANVTSLVAAIRAASPAPASLWAGLVLVGEP